MSDTHQSAVPSPGRSRWAGWAALVGALVTAAPTAVALLAGLALTVMNLFAFDAVENDGADPYLIGFSVVFTAIAVLFGGGLLAAIGLVAHTIGVVCAGLAVRLGHPIAGVLFGAFHSTMLLVDVGFFASYLFLVANS